MTACVHRWTLETPSGTQEVRGECRRCGEVRTFRAMHPIDDPERTPDWRRKRAHSGISSANGGRGA